VSDAAARRVWRRKVCAKLLPAKHQPSQIFWRQQWNADHLKVKAKKAIECAEMASRLRSRMRKCQVACTAAFNIALAAASGSTLPPDGATCANVALHQPPAKVVLPANVALCARLPPLAQCFCSLCTPAAWPQWCLPVSKLQHFLHWGAPWRKILSES
jgi:hypothetical protein